MCASKLQLRSVQQKSTVGPPLSTILVLQRKYTKLQWRAYVRVYRQMTIHTWKLRNCVAQIVTETACYGATYSPGRLMGMGPRKNLANNSGASKALWSENCQKAPSKEHRSRDAYRRWTSLLVYTIIYSGCLITLNTKSNVCSSIYCNTQSFSWLIKYTPYAMHWECGHQHVLRL